MSELDAGDGDGDASSAGAAGDGDGDAGDGDGDIGDGDIGDGDGDMGDGDTGMGGAPSANCGDNVLDPVDNEQCDDGNNAPGDGCSPTCRLDPLGETCGNDKLDPLEKCDPPEGMPADGDGCNATCNLSGVVTTLANIDASSMASDNDFLYLGVNDCAAGECGIARVDVDACTAAPQTAACNPTYIAGGPGFCACGTAVTDGDSATATFSFLEGITTDGTKMWFSQEQTLRELDLTTGVTTTVAGVRGSCAAIDGNGTSGLINNGRAVTYYDGKVYLVDSVEAVLREYDPRTGDLTTIAGTRVPDKDVTQMAPYSCGPGGAGAQHGGGGVVTAGTGLNAIFDSPRYMTPDFQGGLYIIDTNGEAIVHYNLANQRMRVLLSGTTGNSVAYSDGPSTTTSLSRPRGIISDGTSVYFAEQHHATLRQFDLSTSQTSTFVGTMGCSAGGTASTPTRDGTGANTTMMFGDGQNCTSGAPPPMPLTPVFNGLFGAMTFHFNSQSIYMVDGGVLRRIE